MSSWHSYTSLYNMGHAALASLFDNEVIVEEKIDGSQFSFGVINGELKCRSKGQELVVDFPEKMFTEAVDTVKKIQAQLSPGWTYRAEYLKKPKHNTLAYDRIPNNHLIIFDINTEEEVYLLPEEKRKEAERLGLECVPLLWKGTGRPSTEEMLSWLDKTSILGGQKIEGFVIKNYSIFGKNKKALMGKHVSEAFKEIHGGEWKKENPSKKDIIESIIYSLRTPARWEKAIQHLRDEGKLENSPRDIGLLLKEVNVDILKECEEEIKDKLWKYAWPKISRGIVSGLPNWYKEKLLNE